MSQTDSFIEEVTEEVRRDRLFLLLKRYGWIGVLLVLLIVGGAAWREYSRAQDRAEAEALGDSMLAALETEAPEAPEARIAALSEVEAGSARGAALLALLTAAEQSSAGQEAEAAETLGAIAANGEVPQFYRDIAGFRMLLLQSDTVAAAERRSGFEALARAGSPLRLLAEEQIALIDVETGDTEAAIGKFQAILADAEVTAGLRQRVSQVIVALGGELDAA